MSSCTASHNTVAMSMPIHTERTHQVGGHAMMQSIDRPPDHFLTLTSEREMDIQSTADKSITAVFPTGASAHDCVLDEELRGIVAIRILHNSLPSHGVRLALSVDSMGSGRTLGNAVRHVVTERHGAVGDGLSTDTHIQATNHTTASSFEFPLLSSDAVHHQMDTETGKLDAMTPGMYQRTISPNDLPPIYLSPSGQYGRNVSSVSVRWLDMDGELVARVRKVEAYRTLRLGMPPKIMLVRSDAGGGDELPPDLCGMYITPHAGGSVLILSVMSGEVDANRATTGHHTPWPSSFNISVPGGGGGLHKKNESLNGRGVVVSVSISSFGVASIAVLSPGLGFVIGDTITIHATGTLGRHSQLPGSVDLVLRVDSVSFASPLAAIRSSPMLARVTACTMPSIDMLARGDITVLHDSAVGRAAVPVYIGYDSITGESVSMGVDARRREQSYVGIAFGQHAFVRYTQMSGHTVGRDGNDDTHPEMPFTFDLHVDANGGATVTITSMGGGFTAGRYIAVDAGFFTPKTSSAPPTVDFMFMLATFDSSATSTSRGSVLAATTPSFVHDYKWTVVASTSELVCASVGEVHVDGVAMVVPGSRILVQSLCDRCTAECLSYAHDLGAPVDIPAQYNGIYTVTQTGTTTRKLILSLSSDIGDAFTDINFVRRIPVDRGELHGATLRAAALTAYHIPGTPIHFRQYAGVNDNTTVAAVAELEYFKYERKTWDLVTSPPMVYGNSQGRTSEALVDVYASQQDAHAAVMHHDARHSLVLPRATMLQIGGGSGSGTSSAYPNATVRDTLALMTSPFQTNSGTVMHVARIQKPAHSNSHPHHMGSSSAAAADELYTAAAPPRKRQAGTGPAPPRHVPTSGGLLMVDIDVPHMTGSRPTADRVAVTDTVVITSASTHNDALRQSRTAAMLVQSGTTTVMGGRMYARGVASVQDITRVFCEQVGIMPWTITLGFYKGVQAD
jgi:hypothetical protein